MSFNLNSILAKKVLEKLTLKELYEIKNNKKVLYEIGLVILHDNDEDLFIDMVSSLIEEAIQPKNPTAGNLSNLLKTWRKKLLKYYEANF